jgi:hypothetical protein
MIIIMESIHERTKYVNVSTIHDYQRNNYQHLSSLNSATAKQPSVSVPVLSRAMT